MTAVHLVDRTTSPELSAAVRAAHWSTAAGIELLSTPDGADAVVLVADRALPADDDLKLASLAQRLPVLLVGPTCSALDPQGPLAKAAGVAATGATPVHEVRVRCGEALDPRGEGDLTVVDRFAAGETAVEVEVLATAALGLTAHPVVTWSPATRVGIVGIGALPTTWADRRFLRLLARTVAVANGQGEPRDVRVGLLGYGAIGHEHNRAVSAVPGLTLTAVCDRNPERVAAARVLAADVRAYDDGHALVADDEVDLVVVSTPPNSHATWALDALRAGRHVVLEKPMALTTSDCDEILRTAAEVDRLVVVYQNRRRDPDFAALRAVVEAGEIGDVFHVESFVGGYGHPCNYWHSDVSVSGGAVFDWGSHVLDQVLALLPGEVTHVTAANHKRVWHDVTNADHARVTVRFAGGAEAEFVYSDLAAAHKPKWYVLGTRGAVVGSWRHERVVSRTDIGTLAEDRLAPADSPASMAVHHADGSVTELALPDVPPYWFHRDLADRLLAGLPMTVTAAQSRRVVGLMEAAEESAAKDGYPVVPR